MLIPTWVSSLWSMNVNRKTFLSELLLSDIRDRDRCQLLGFLTIRPTKLQRGEAVASLSTRYGPCSPVPHAGKDTLDLVSRAMISGPPASATRKTPPQCTALDRGILSLSPSFRLTSSDRCSAHKDMDDDGSRSAMLRCHLPTAVLHLPPRQISRPTWYLGAT